MEPNVENAKQLLAKGGGVREGEPTQRLSSERKKMQGKRGRGKGTLIRPRRVLRAQSSSQANVGALLQGKIVKYLEKLGGGHTRARAGRGG